MRQENSMQQQLRQVGVGLLNILNYSHTHSAGTPSCQQRTAYTWYQCKTVSATVTLHPQKGGADIWMDAGREGGRGCLPIEELGACKVQHGCSEVLAPEHLQHSIA